MAAVAERVGIATGSGRNGRGFCGFRVDVITNRGGIGKRNGSKTDSRRANRARGMGELAGPVSGQMPGRAKKLHSSLTCFALGWSL
jgi:hypothetical protein